MPDHARRITHRRTIAAVGALAAVGLVAPTGSSAASVVAQNACYYGLDGFWRNQDVRVAGEAAPVYVPPGAGFTLTGTAAAATFPGWIPEYGFNLGFLNGSPTGVRNAVPAEAWMAVAGKGSAQGVQVVRAKVTAETTVTTDATGEKFVSATPLSFTVPLADTTWTAPDAAGAAVTFEQAPPGTLPSLPAVGGGPAVSPRGSIFIRASLTNSTSFDLDCQPGRATGDGTAFSPAATSPFAVAYVDPNAVPTGVVPPPVPSPPLVVRSTSLRTNAARTRATVEVQNTGGLKATGQLKVTTAAKQRLRPRGPKRTVLVQDWADYAIAPGGTSTIVVRLSKDLRTVLRAKKTVNLEVATRAANGLKTATGLPRFAPAARVTLPLRRR